ncbi:MAG: tripartite tricarboxylate transporter substrate binding protein [Betaproteobacteria bacterium]|nr:tripartite tricarboxylate transporter substrate binding protein [Betaproteobacteria bacterium]
MARTRARRVLSTALLGVASVLAAGASAADYPARPIRYVVAFAPGAINDIVARIVGQKLNEVWGQPVIVDNRANVSSAHTIAQSLYPRLGYSLERDLTPVVVFASSPLIMTIHPGIPARNVAELVAWAKKNRMVYASGGVGVISHLSMELFKQAAGIDATHVPYKGGGPGAIDVAAGHVHLMTNTIPTLLPFVKAGKLRVLGIMAEKRHRLMPDVPTFIEQKYRDFVMGNWMGIVAPTGTPRPIVNKLAAEVTRIVRSPDVGERFSREGLDVLGGTPEEFGRLIRSEIERFGKAVKASGAKVD